MQKENNLGIEIKDKVFEKRKELNIYQKLIWARSKIHSLSIKKGGKHVDYKNKREFSYFELSDFLPQATLFFNEIGLVSIFNLFYEKENDNEIDEKKGIAKLEIINVDNPEEKIVFETPIACAKVPNTNPAKIQILGSQHTYLRRYLYLNALDIAENDVVDATPQSEEEDKKEKIKATEDQKIKIRKEYNLEELNILLKRKNKKTLDELTITEASNLLQNINNIKEWLQEQQEKELANDQKEMEGTYEKIHNVSEGKEDL